MWRSIENVVIYLSIWLILNALIKLWAYYQENHAKIKYSVNNWEQYFILVNWGALFWVCSETTYYKEFDIEKPSVMGMILTVLAIVTVAMIYLIPRTITWYITGGKPKKWK